jgi:hypothetical protein
MPHCDVELHERLLRRNFSPDSLSNVLMITNDLSVYVERLVLEIQFPLLVTSSGDLTLLYLFGNLTLRTFTWAASNTFFFDCFFHFVVSVMVHRRHLVNPVEFWKLKPRLWPVLVSFNFAVFFHIRKFQITCACSLCVALHCSLRYWI